MFKTVILVRFGDLDGAGIAYYPNLVNFLHEAFEDLVVDMRTFRPIALPPWMRERFLSGMADPERGQG